MNLPNLALVSGVAYGVGLAVVVSASTTMPEPPTDFQGLAVIITAITLASASIVSSALAIATFVVARKSAQEINTVKRDVAEVKQTGIVTHDLVNSLSEKKDAAQKQAAFAEGKEAGVEAERADPKVSATPPTT